MNSSNCYVCHSESHTPIFRSEENWSLTSTCELIEGETNVDFCNDCGHIQTQLMLNEREFYEDSYQILTNSFDEDQLICDEQGKQVFRSTAQAELLLENLNFEADAQVLDFGCAKGATAFQIKQSRPGWNVSLFDHSSLYKGFWQNHLQDFESACGVIPSSWSEKFDAVVSCYVLEHISDLSNALSSIRAVLKPSGQFQFLVPNVQENFADLLVTDHVNHFTTCSLETLLQKSGFQIKSIDSNAISGALFVTAEKSEELMSLKLENVAEIKSQTLESVLGISQFWQGVKSQILEFEDRQSDERRAVIYGAGFYGASIHQMLKNTDRITCFLDANPHRQGQEFLGKPILAPEEIPNDVKVIYCGLNPRISRRVLSEYETTCWQNQLHQVCYLDANSSHQEAVA